MPRRHGLAPAAPSRPWYARTRPLAFTASIVSRTGRDLTAYGA
jgi:hypothetical protein